MAGQFDRRTLLQTQLKGLANQGINLSVSHISTQMVAAVNQQASGATAETLGQIASFFNDSVRSRRRSLTSSYQDVGDQANKATLARYNRTVGGSGPYRQNASGKMRRDAGGRLASALASPKMYQAGPNGIAYINPKWLDKNARQWYRINFGAGARGQGSARPASKRILFFGQEAGRIGLESFAPSPSFILPGGFFQDSRGKLVKHNPARRGQDRFDPSNYSGMQDTFKAQSRAFPDRRVSQGIAARNYLDAGVDVIARGAPLVTTTFIRDVVSKSLAAGGASGAPAKVALDVKDLERILKSTEDAIDKLPRQAARLSGQINRRYPG